MPFSLACVFLFGFSLYSIYHEEEEHIERDFLNSFNAIQSIYSALINNRLETLRTALDFVVQDETLKAAFRAGDRQALLALSEPLYQRLNQDTQITHFYFNDAKRRNFLRVHQPQRYGDLINRFTTLDAESSGKTAGGPELGPLGTFTLRAVAPWREDGQLLGYIELGGEIEHEMHELGTMFDAGFFLLVSKQHLDREDWEQGMRMLGREGNWDLLPDLVVPARSDEGLPLGLLAEARVPSWSDPVRVRSIHADGKYYRSAVFPLKDAGNRTVGGILVVRDMSMRVVGTLQTIGIIAVIALMVGLSLFWLFYKILGRAELQLESREQRIMEETQTRLTMQESHVRELERAALYDTLTGLPNRKLLDARISEAIGVCRREGRTFALMLLDVDRLREINDTLGHEVGDRLLQQVAAVLRQAVVEADTIARLTGGEFSLLLPAVDANGANTIALKIQQLFGRTFQTDGTSLSVGAKVGIALFPEHGDAASLLIRRADVALHQAKRLKTTQAFYDNAMDPFSVRKLNLVNDLRKAINGRDLNLHYQPQLDAASGEIVGVEALARWHHPEQGFVSPVEFVALAENAGLIGALTSWVLNEALRQCREWEEQGLAINISVNVSAHNLMDASFPGLVTEALQRWQFPPQRLILEVTESVFMLETDHSLKILDELRDLGTQLSIDDFGTGYSSLVYLKRMPVHELKIDQNFVRDMVQNENDASIVSSTVALAHCLGMKIVAEGVETEEVFINLKELGCDIVQGYYFARPMPAEDLLGWIENSAARARA